MSRPPYIALLRGINVSGKNKLPMADLQALCAALGWQQVQTYIQSGNVYFEADEADVDVLAKALAQAIQEKFGYKVPVLVRPRPYFQQLAEAHPALDEQPDPKHLHVTLLAEAPTATAAASLEEQDWSPDRIWIKEKAAFLHCPNGYGRTKLTNGFLEKKLGVTATTRNWRTLQKLVTWNLA